VAALGGGRGGHTGRCGGGVSGKRHIELPPLLFSIARGQGGQKGNSDCMRC